MVLLGEWYSHGIAGLCAFLAIAVSCVQARVMHRLTSGKASSAERCTLEKHLIYHLALSTWGDGGGGEEIVQPVLPCEQ